MAEVRPDFAPRRTFVDRSGFQKIPSAQEGVQGLLGSKAHLVGPQLLVALTMRSRTSQAPKILCERRVTDESKAILVLHGARMCIANLRLPEQPHIKLSMDFFLF